MQIEIYTRNDCPACRNLKYYLISNNINYTDHRIGVNITRDQVKEKFPHLNEIPIIILDGEQTPYNKFFDQMKSQHGV